MSVQYIRVNAIADLFAPAVRAFGNIAIIGEASKGPEEVPKEITAPAQAKETFQDPTTVTTATPDPKDLAHSIAVAFRQTPGPSLVYGVRTKDDAAGNPDWAKSLELVSGLAVQLVVLANVPVNTITAATGGPIDLLVKHVTDLSTDKGGDGMERMGVAMLAKGEKELPKKPAPSTELLIPDNERMVYIAHKSDEDAAAAVAGTIAGYEPHISMLLKPVNIKTDLFTPADINTINGTEQFKDGPAGKGVNWLTDPVLIPGRGIHMGEGYTGSPGGKKFIDIVRALDDVSFRLKARLIRTIGTLRISRSGLRALRAQMEAELDPLVSNEVIEGYEIVIPVLTLLDKDPNTLTNSEGDQIKKAQDKRVIEVLVAADYAGAIHRLAITLKFE